MTTRCLGVASATSASARTRRTTTRPGAVGGGRETRARVEGRRARGVAARGGSPGRERASERGRRASALLGDQEVREPRGRAAGEDHRVPRAFRSPPPPPPPRSRGAPPRALQRVFPFPAGKSRLAARLARAPARAPRIGRVRPPRDAPPPLRSTARRGRRRRRERRTRARAAPRIAGPPDRVVVRGRSAPCAPQARIEQAGKRSQFREPASRSGLTRRTVFGFWFLVFGFWFLLTFKGGKKTPVDNEEDGRMVIRLHSPSPRESKRPPHARPPLTI